MKRLILIASLTLLGACASPTYSYSGPCVVQLYDANGKVEKEITSSNVRVNYSTGKVKIDGVVYDASYAIYRK